MPVMMPPSGLHVPSRRRVLQTGGAAALAGLFGANSAGAGLFKPAANGQGITLNQVKGPFQNNGATPWYATMPLGTPGQNLKFAIDTGSNFIWSTSTLCDQNGNSCKHYGGSEFNYIASGSFEMIDSKQQQVDFGPWGVMNVETGSDLFAFPNGYKNRTTFYLAASYTGTQFEELDWDGGIGFPSGSDYVQPGISFMMQDLMNAGQIDPAYPYVSFAWNAKTRTGTCQIGGTDPSIYNPDAGIAMPWAGYTEFPDVQYIWSTPMKLYAVGEAVLGTDIVFALDSGSSQFKGDTTIMNNTLMLLGNNGASLPVTMQMGTQIGTGDVGTLVIDGSTYYVEIEAGQDQGQIIPQFAPLGLTNLVLVGSVLMESFYTVFEYSVTKGASGYRLDPANMYLYNLLAGPQLIQPNIQAGRTRVFGPKPVLPASSRRA